MKEIPSSVYRLQLNHTFPVAKVFTLLDYFERLGVGFLYFSPLTTARQGSLHGYDCIDFEMLNPEIGREEELERLSKELRKRGMGILLDIVPNHMSRSEGNKWWADVEKKGSESPYAPFFDIEWDEQGKIRNVRRFFDISNLISLRMEYPPAFEAVHKLPFKWLEKGWIQGLRIDHIDGLYYPQVYLETVSEKGCYLVVEKILVGEEKLHPQWPVEGTTGYDFLNQVNGLFVHPDGFEQLRKIYANFCVQKPQEMEEVIFQAKEEVLKTTLTPEVERLNRLLPCAGTISLLAHFPVYRTYLTPNNLTISEQDQHWLQKAFETAILSREDKKTLWDTFFQKRNIPFIQFFQQVSGPAMAKGAEDTALYRYYPLASVNDVGMDPHHPWNSVDRFHEQNHERLKLWPHTLLATSTHDTKRSEDVRARINVLSECAEEWGTAVQAWNQNHPFPQDPSLEYLIYQTLLGTWGPDSSSRLYVERIQAYFLKVIKEAKLHTSWVKVDPSYEEAVQNYIAALLQNSVFKQEMDRWFQKVEEPGKRNSLAQLILKLTLPGVPDIYRGQEEWQWTLVDPDNRQPIHFEEPNTKNSKHNLTQTLLNFRKTHPLLFQKGSYDPIKMENGIGFGRTYQNQQLLVFVDRFFTNPSKHRQVDFPANYKGEFTDLLTGQKYDQLSSYKFFIVLNN